MFRREHHQHILTALTSLNAQFLLKNECYFGGGTAIVLSLDEYRESVDIDLLCASADGYRELRNTINNVSLGEIFSCHIELLREVRADRYGIRVPIVVDGVTIKFEIVREDRIRLHGKMDPVLCVPILDRADMYAEKLLANADRWNEPSTASRDIIDLAMMIKHWGPIPAAAWQKVRAAYGASVDQAYNNALLLVSNEQHLGECLAKMHMDPGLVTRIPAVLAANAPVLASMATQTNITGSPQP